jgi:hypothetical protein
MPQNQWFTVNVFLDESLQNTKSEDVDEIVWE